MKSARDIGIIQVQNVYSGPEARLWELIMGEQIHMGGFGSSLDLAKTAGIGAGMAGVDLCCCSGAGMRFLVRFCQVAQMRGVDATAAMVELGQKRCAQEGLGRQISFTLAEASATGLPAGGFDFVWGEDAWCYVPDKPKLIAEAVRLVKPGGLIAFTDWVEGPVSLAEAQADWILHFMKFPSLASVADYTTLLSASGCKILAARDTGRFAPCVDLYCDMINKQLTYDALKIVGFDAAVLEELGKGMGRMQTLAHAGSLVQGLFVARKGD